MPGKKENLQAEVNIGMIGHVDHGKTSLTKALTGTWTDTHSEELKRGISIRLGYADASFYKCDKCKGAEAYSANEECQCGAKGKLLRSVSFIDAPGHETLMTTMLGGAALMDGALLVIAANEKCPQPRTEEHLIALEISGVKKIVVVQNKVDLVSKENAVKNGKEIVSFLKKHGYENVPIIPTVANFNINIDLLIEAIEKNIETKKSDMKKPLKAYIARSFDINKPGVKVEKMVGGVVGGSIAQGVLKPGDKIEITPGIDETPLTSVCVSLNNFSGSLDAAKPGGLIAIGTKLDPSLTRNDHMRGQIVCKPGSMPKPTKKITIELHMFERLVDNAELHIKQNDKVVLTIGTMTSVGTVVKKSGKNEFEIALNSAAVVEKGQRIAVNKKHMAQWRLAAYGVCK